MGKSMTASPGAKSGSIVPAVLGPLTLIAVLALVLEWGRPDLLLVGNITVDIVEDTTPTGGAVSYAAALARALRVKACVVTVAGPEANLSVFKGAALTVVPANETLTFEHTYAWWGHARKLRVTANPNITLTRAHVPPWCRNARVVLLGPLTLHDLDAASFLTRSGWLDAWFNSAQLVGFMAQGFQRLLDAEGAVLPLKAPSSQLLAGLGHRVSLFLSDVETVTWSEGELQQVAGSVDRLLVTEGEKGAMEYQGDRAVHVPIVEVGKAVDTNGAGDTFATMYMIALMRGMQQPSAVASWAASRAVLQPQSCKPECAPALVPEGIAPMSEVERLQLAARSVLRPLLAALEGSGVVDAALQLPGVMAAVEAGQQAWSTLSKAAGEAWARMWPGSSSRSVSSGIGSEA